MAGMQEGVGLPGTTGEGVHPGGLTAQPPLGSRGGGEAGPRPSSPSGGHLGHFCRCPCPALRPSPPRPPGLLLMADGALRGSPGSLVPGDMLPLAGLLEVAGALGASSDLGQNPRAGPKPGPHASPSFLHRRGAGLGRSVNRPPLMGREREQVGKPAGHTRLLPRPPGHLPRPPGPLATLRVPLGLPGPLQGPAACPAPRLMPGPASGRGDQWVGQALWSPPSPQPRAVSPPPPGAWWLTSVPHTTRGCRLLVAGSGLPELALHCPAPRARWWPPPGGAPVLLSG